MNRTISLWSWVLLVALWLLLSYSGVSKLILANPMEVTVAFAKAVTCSITSEWKDVCLWPHLYSTLLSVSISFTMGFLLGAGLGVIMGSCVLVENALASPINFLRAIPVTALGTVFLAIFGIDSWRIACAVFGTSLVIAVGVWEGLKNCPQEIVDAAQLDGAGKIDLLRHVTWYLALPFIYANVRIALSLCLVLVVVGEMFMGGKYGMGKMIFNAQYSYNIPLAWAGIIILGLIGSGINRILDKLKPYFIDFG